MRRTRTLAVAALAAASLVLTACSGGDTGGSDGSGSGDTSPIVVGTQKPTSLIPGNSRGYFALNVAETLFSGLTKYDPETGEPILLVASDITTEDQQTWHITLNEGWTFHNGEPVDSESFARAWNAVANPENAWLGSGSMSIIQGYSDVAPAEGDPTATELSGISIESPTEFTVTLNAPNSQFLYLVGQPAFYPMAQESLDDLDTLAVHPIGNGPYKLVEPWTGGDEIVTERFDEYGGEVAKNSGVIFRVYTGNDVAYRDYQAGEVDIVTLNSTDVAAAQSTYADLVFRTDKAAAIAYLSVPLYAEGYDDVRIRQALSMAIDRQQIIDAIFNDDSYVPATDIGAPAAVGYRDDACEYCEFNPEEAKRLWDEAGGLPEARITVVTGTGRDAYSEAIINMWEENLGANVAMDFVPSENTHAAILGQEVQNPASLARISDYPSPYAIIGSGFLSGAASNYSFYENPEYDELIAQALAASPEEAQGYFDQAKDLLLEDVAHIPLWGSGQTYVVSERVAGSFYADAFNKSVYSTFTVE